MRKPFLVFLYVLAQPTNYKSSVPCITDNDLDKQQSSCWNLMQDNAGIIILMKWDYRLWVWH